MSQIEFIYSISHSLATNGLPTLGSSCLAFILLNKGLIFVLKFSFCGDGRGGPCTGSGLAMCWANPTQAKLIRV